MTVLYRKHRPQKFSDLIGQESVANTLLAQIENGKIGHGYLFFGPRGTGKTSAARIFAKAVNCEVYKQKAIGDKKQVKFGEPCNKCQSCISITDGSNLDLIEIDAASNRGIDEIRDLREKIKLSPISSRFKVYIIDEAHMLTSEAFNALLKTLEEPPAHAIFILATTEKNKLPETIISRLQKFNFSRAASDHLQSVIGKVAKMEGIKIKDEAAAEIAAASEGSFRDALSILDQVAYGKNEVTPADISKIAKASSWNSLHKISENLADKKLAEVINQIEENAASGTDMLMFTKQILLYLQKILFIKAGIELIDGEVYSKEQAEKMKELAERFSSYDLQKLLKLFLISENEMKLYPLPQIPLTLAVFDYIGEEGVEKSATQENSDKSDNSDISTEESGNLNVKNRISVKTSEETDKVEKSDNGHVKTHKKGKVTLSKVEEKWETFLNKVRTQNAHVVALLRSTKPTGFDGDFLLLEVFYRFHKEKLEEAKIIKMLDSILSDLLNHSVKLKFVLAQKGSAQPGAVRKSDVVDDVEKGIEKIAQEIFAK